MKELIVNADDFGLHSSVNQAVLYGHAHGAITSASLMPTGDAFEEAAAAAVSTPTLGVGVHLTLVAQRPLCDPSAVRTLVGADGNFLGGHMEFIRRYMRGNIDIGETYRELSAQIGRVLETGARVTHLDSHQHLHVLPEIMDVCVQLAKEYKIRAVRIPAEAYFFRGGYPAGPGRALGKCGLTFLAKRARKKAREGALAAPDHFFGMLAGGHMSKGYLREILDALPDGVSEIMIHPGTNTKLLRRAFGWNYDWEEELSAVTDREILQCLKDQHVKLRSFGELFHA